MFCRRGATVSNRAQTCSHQWTDGSFPMIESPPGFVLRSELQQAAFANGFRIVRGENDGWLRYGSTTARGDIWLAGMSDQGPWILGVGNLGVAQELGTPDSGQSGPGAALFTFTTLSALHSAIGRTYQLGVSLPDAPLERFRKRVHDLPSNTEAERLVVQRIGQQVFRDALLEYWGGRCPLTGITDTALLRASHIVPWSECNDELRLDVHNGLLLSALWDAAFDTGLVSFSDTGVPMFAVRLCPTSRALLESQCRSSLHGLTFHHQNNLRLHRTRHGFG